MGTRLFTLLATLVIGGLLAGCASGSGTPRAGESGSSVSPSASSSSSPSPSPSGSTPSGSQSSAPDKADITLSGQVEAGIEVNCLILRSGGKVYQLMGGDQNVIKAGNNVTVRGHVATGVMSYCMQGEPFQVTEARLS
jgi:hypothetical protein